LKEICVAVPAITTLSKVFNAQPNSWKELSHD
jgi:hypothetical protein